MARKRMLSFRLHPVVVDAIDRLAAEAGLTRTEWITAVVSRAVLVPSWCCRTCGRWDTPTEFVQGHASRRTCLRCHRWRGRVARGVDPIDAALEQPVGVRCEVCGSDGSGTVRPGIFLDHDHETGRARGWLCNGCNLGIGHLTTPELATAAATYLARTLVMPSRPAMPTVDDPVGSVDIA